MQGLCNVLGDGSGTPSHVLLSAHTAWRGMDGLNPMGAAGGALIELGEVFCTLSCADVVA